VETRTPATAAMAISRKMVFFKTVSPTRYLYYGTTLSFVSPVEEPSDLSVTAY
jgi:hypothetical protein